MAHDDDNHRSHQHGSHDLVVRWDELDPKGKRTGIKSFYQIPFAVWHQHPQPGDHRCCQEEELERQMGPLIEAGVVVAAVPPPDVRPEGDSNDSTNLGCTCYLLDLSRMDLDERDKQIQDLFGAHQE